MNSVTRQREAVPQNERQLSRSRCTQWNCAPCPWCPGPDLRATLFPAQEEKGKPQITQKVFWVLSVLSGYYL